MSTYSPFHGLGVSECQSYRVPGENSCVCLWCTLNHNHIQKHGPVNVQTNSRLIQHRSSLRPCQLKYTTKSHHNHNDSFWLWYTYSPIASHTTHHISSNLRIQNTTLSSPVVWHTVLKTCIHAFVSSLPRTVTPQSTSMIEVFS